MEWYAQILTTLKHKKMKKLQITIALLLYSVISLAQDITGTWSGTIGGEGKEIVFVFDFEINKNGGYTSIMAIPTMRMSDIKPKTTSFENGKLLIDGSNLGMKYEGTYIQSTQQIEGTYREGGAILSLVLNRGKIELEEKANRPQEPVKPYPYHEEEVVFENKKAEVSLSGTITLPYKNGKFPVVILISGSGPQDRDETFLTHKPFLIIADYLTRKGIAVLRYDDRGFGKSTGDHSTATTADFATDVISAVNYLKSRADIDTQNIGLVGHSEGGIIAPLAANQTKNIAFIVLLASTGVSGSELSIQQAKTLRPFSVPDENAFEQFVRKLIKIASSHKTITSIKSELTAHYNSYLPPILISLGVTNDQIPEVITQEVEASITPWKRYFYNYNPADEIEKLRIPILSLNGSKDTQVLAEMNQNGIRNALIKGKNENYKVLELADLNHLFQECQTGNINEYDNIEQTISPIALKEISSWILNQVR